MTSKKILRFTWLRPKLLVFIFIALAGLMVISALIELRSSKQELLRLMEDQTRSQLETLLLASDNALRSNELLESTFDQRLFRVAEMVQTQIRQREVTNRGLQKLVTASGIKAISIFNKHGDVKLFNESSDNPQVGATLNAVENLQPIFSGQRDTLYLGLQTGQGPQASQYAVAVATEDSSAIVLSLDAEPLLHFRRQTGFGVLLRQIITNPGIVYAALQDTTGIIAASGNITQLESVANSIFLRSVLSDSALHTRQTDFDSIAVFEAAEPFYYQENLVGIFRLGLSMAPIEAINSRIYRRIISMTVVLFGLGFIVFVAIIARQNYDLLQRQYQMVETYSSNIIDNVGDGIIVAGEKSGVQVFNQAAGELFSIHPREAIGESLRVILGEETCAKILQNDASIREIQCEINGTTKSLIVSKTEFTDTQRENNIIVVFRDLTEQKRLQDQAQRNERLTAMGELASGVAHEIRNPLNAIGTIIQQLRRDFKPANDVEEYEQLTELVSQEVKRINETIQHFLQFTRPLSVQMEPFQLSELLSKIERQYQSLANEHDIEFSVAQQWDGEVRWDRQQMQQVLMNLLQNAIDALEDGGSLSIIVSEIQHDHLEIRVIDDGPGIPEPIRQKIFNLYFTTKPKGTGIGLGIVQRVVIEHGGVITVDSQPGKGTTFIIQVPQRVQPDIEK